MITAPVPMVSELPSADPRGAVACVAILSAAFVLSFALAVWDEYSRSKRDKVLPREFLPPTRPEDKDARRD